MVVHQPLELTVTALKVHEPDRSNPNLYLWHYPYAGQSDPDGESTTSSPPAFEPIFWQAWNETWNAAVPDVNTVYPDYTDFFQAVMSNITPAIFAEHGIMDWSDPHIWGGAIGHRARVFHPQFMWHKAIMTSILTQYGAFPAGMIYPACAVSDCRLSA